MTLLGHWDQCLQVIIREKEEASVKGLSGRLWKKSALCAVTLKIYAHGILTAPIAPIRAALPSLHAWCVLYIITLAKARRTNHALLHSGRDKGTSVNVGSVRKYC